MVKGMKQMHDLGIIHKDIKCGNTFLNKDGTVKLGDMNISKVKEKLDGSNLQSAWTGGGTSAYSPPEVVWKDRGDHKK